MSAPFPKLSSWFRMNAAVEFLAVLLWGVLLVKYWVTGELNILIHPNYFALTVIGGVVLLVLAGWKVWEWIAWGRSRWGRTSGNNGAAASGNEQLQHISLFPPGWSAAILLTAAIMGLIFEPRVFSSDKALNRGIEDFMPITQVKAQAFGKATSPEDRSLVDWVRTLSVYPEPDAYSGQPVKVTGFVIHPPELGEEYLLLARYIITCCAADAYPIGLPVKLPNNRSAYPSDSWLEVQGKMITETFDDRRQLTIEAEEIAAIEQPKNPYEY
ncbi:MAG: TIGR03943 family protein [Cyanobacteria bacterium J007]|nr:MAG: TIGR03943 family protein [Cyanobacteria bacterium J007]